MAERKMYKMLLFLISHAQNGMPITDQSRSSRGETGSMIMDVRCFANSNSSDPDNIHRTAELIQAEDQTVPGALSAKASSASARFSFAWKRQVVR